MVAALALAAARKGLRVLAIEVGRDEHIPRLLVPNAAPVGHAGRSLLPGLTVLRVDPFEALAEYLSLQVKVRSLVQLVVGNRGFRQLMNASPGWRELITLGKIWHLEQSLEPDGRPRFDLLIVDAPATGHGLTFLDVPRVVVSAVRTGPLRQHTEEVERLIEDPTRTVLLPVTLAEELPTRETVELVTRVREGVGVAIDRVVVNAMVPAPFPPGLERLDECLARLPADADLGELPEPAALAACAAFLRARHELGRTYTAQLAAQTGLPLVELPYLSRGVRDREDLATLGAALLEIPGAPGG